MLEIYLRRRSKVLLPDAPGTTPLEVVATFQRNLESLGFALAPEVLDRLRETAPQRVATFYRQLLKALKERVGAHRAFRPLYPNFPDQVMSLTEAELYWNACRHYRTLERPADPTVPRPDLAETPTPRLVGLGDREDFEGMFARLVGAKTALSATDQADLRWFVAQYGDDIARLLPETVPNRENLARLGAELLRRTAVGATFLDRHIRTATDVLRLAVALGDGDVSLAVPSKFGKFRRRERALLLGWIERAENRTEDLLRRKSRWIRLGERLHPGEYARRFPLTAGAFEIVRNGLPYESFNGRLEAALVRRDAAGAANLLADRPGEMARRLDHLLRLADDPHAVLERFAGFAARVASSVLLQMLSHFRGRDTPTDLRAFFPKGQVASLFATLEPLPPLRPGLAARAASLCESSLLERFGRLPPLGKCHLDPRLKDYLVPFSQRSASKALRTIVRGSRLPLPEGDTLRFFVWWKNGTSRTDIDLSAAMFAEDYRYIDTLAYYNLKTFGAHHSGDVVDAPLGAAEFIDLDLVRCRERGVRYVVMCLNSFTSQPYRDLPECFAGWMARRAPASGEIFEPKTVVDKVDVASDTEICLPAIFDLVDRTTIWADIALAGSPYLANNVQNNLGGVSLMVRALTHLRKPDLHTLFDLHIRARGQLAATPAEAETVFAVDRGLTPFDLDRIVTEYL